MTEVYFYHLERQPLETVLPQLLEKTLARGWRAVVQIGLAERVEAISTLLWSYRDDFFSRMAVRRMAMPCASRSG